MLDLLITGITHGTNGGSDGIIAILIGLLH
jgi:hypothetical protein